LAARDFIRDLELQAKVDSYLLLKYFLACCNASGQLEKMDRLWLRHHLFERVDLDYHSTVLQERYGETTHLAEKYTRFIDALPPAER
jgi:hypothetical protein